jgi:hypothetical protein
MMISTRRVLICTLGFAGVLGLFSNNNNNNHVTASSVEEDTVAATTVTDEELYDIQHQRRKLTWDFFSFLLMSTSFFFTSVKRLLFCDCFAVVLIQNRICLQDDTQPSLSLILLAIPFLTLSFSLSTTTTTTTTSGRF